MFLLVSVRHVGAHPGEHQHGVSIQISIILGKTFLRISRIRNIPLTWILARVFVYVPPLISQILDFTYWTVSICILIYFEWRDTENQQYHRVLISSFSSKSAQRKHYVYVKVECNKWLILACESQLLSLFLECFFFFFNIYLTDVNIMWSGLSVYVNNQTLRSACSSSAIFFRLLKLVTVLTGQPIKRPQIGPLTTQERCNTHFM